MAKFQKAFVLLKVAPGHEKKVVDGLLKIKEVQEAHISYEKARLQLGYAQQKIAFREEQVKILKAQASVNEALPSQVLEAVMRLTEEKVGQAQALTNYYVALAKLNKAVGLSGRYK